MPKLSITKHNSTKFAKYGFVFWLTTGWVNQPLFLLVNYRHGSAQIC